MKLSSYIHNLFSLSESELEILRLLAETVITPGKYFPAGGMKDAEKIYNFSKENKEIIYLLKPVLNYLKLKRFHKLSVSERIDLLQRKKIFYRLNL